MNNGFKHTPGPWFYSTHINEGEQHAEITLSPTSGYREDTNEYLRISGLCSEADAKLIAAAPDLLKVLIGLRGNVHAMEHIDPTRMDEAIKKATE